MDVKDGSVLVTGASRGLGFEVARAMARKGAKVVMVARDRSRLDAAAAAIRAEGGQAHPLAFDVGDKEAIHRIAGAAAALVGPIDVLVHCASTLGPLPMPLLVDTACEDLERVLQVNLVGPFRLTKALVGSMALRGRGIVVFVSSDAATNAYAHWGAYGVSKAALDHLGRTFAAELDPVRFFVVDPGEMDTTMHAAAFPEADRSTFPHPRVAAEAIAELVARARSTPNGQRSVVSA